MDAPVDRCKFYGRFMSGLSRVQADYLYWGFFTSVLLVLFCCSWNYGRTMERIEGLGTDDPMRHRLLRQGFWTALLGSLLACFFGILSAFTLLSLEFCHDEALANLYWSTWVVLVVGGIVAVFGISLHMRNLIKSRKLPPWALALGTPVLVVAGLGHYFQGKFSRKARRIADKIKNKSKDQENGIDLSLTPSVGASSLASGSHAFSSKARTKGSPYMSTPDELSVKIIRFTDEGDMVIRISSEVQQQLNAKYQMSTTTLGSQPDIDFLSKVEIPKSPGTPWSTLFPPHKETEF